MDRKYIAFAVLFITVAMHTHASSGIELLSIFNNLTTQSNNLEKIIKIPTLNNKIQLIAQSDCVKQIVVARQAMNARPILHNKVLKLVQSFLDFKLKFGTDIEKELYTYMTPMKFIDRLLVCRPMTFMTGSDIYLLRNGQRGQGGFETIGTNIESYPLLLEDYISYDEMQVAAFLGISTPTYFINDGARDNAGRLGLFNTYEESGVYTGLVGARFEKPGLMEYQHMIITQEQNTTENGYGAQCADSKKAEYIKLWEAFYDEKFPTFEQAQQDVTGKYICLPQMSSDLASQKFLHRDVYKKRMKFVLEPFLLDANLRGEKMNKQVYCSAVGLGLGVWMVSEIQAQFMLEVYAQILEEHELLHISDINFGYFPAKYQSCAGKSNLEFMKHIKIHFSKTNPASKLVGVNSEKLLVAMYAWDGNAYPGNEYWIGQLTASGDPAAASCSTIAELQNPLINRYVSSDYLLVL